jgi:hypothetical protein
MRGKLFTFFEGQVGWSGVEEKASQRGERENLNLTSKSQEVQQKVFWVPYWEWEEQKGGRWEALK